MSDSDVEKMENWMSQPMEDCDLRDCPECKQTTLQDIVYYNPDNPDEGMVYQCLKCGENTGWV